MKGGQRKMEVYTVSCHGGRLKACQSAGAHSHPVNPSVSILSSATIHPFSYLSLLQWWGQRKALNHLPTLPPSSFPLGPSRQSSEAWLAIVTWPHGEKDCAHKHKFVHRHTIVTRRRTRASFARSDYPWSKKHRGKGDGGEEVGKFAIFNVSHHPQDLHIQRLKCLSRGKKIELFLVLAVKFFFFLSFFFVLWEHINIMRQRKWEEWEKRKKTKKMWINDKYPCREIAEEAELKEIRTKRKRIKIRLFSQFNNNKEKRN